MGTVVKASAEIDDNEIDAMTQTNPTRLRYDLDPDGGARLDAQRRDDQEHRTVGRR